jgi:putative transposase
MAIVRMYRRNLPHIQVEANPHLVTFCTYQRRHLTADEREIIFRSCLHENGCRLRLHALVVMPDHVHLLATPLADTLLSTTIGSIKSASAHLINRKVKRSRRIWQEEYFDHSIRSDEYLNTKMAYVLQNPVRKHLVANAREYKWVWTADPEFMRNLLL